MKARGGRRAFKITKLHSLKTSKNARKSGQKTFPSGTSVWANTYTNIKKSRKKKKKQVETRIPISLCSHLSMIGPYTITYTVLKNREFTGYLTVKNYEQSFFGIINAHKMLLDAYTTLPAASPIPVVRKVAVVQNLYLLYKFFK